jgi:hypothetical protein
MFYFLFLNMFLRRKAKYHSATNNSEGIHKKTLTSVE